MFALVDCNNFFVSCERVFRPDLEGKPVVVLSNNDGCVVSRSNESKAMGIKMGTPFFRLKNLTDSGALTAFSSNYALYGDLSGRIMSILADAVPKIEIYSIDEAYLVLDGMDAGKAEQLCRAIVEKVRRWVGIPVSIGLAGTKTLAKVASHFAKKYKGYRGVCIIDNEVRLHKALELTPIAEVWGVGRRLAPKMEAKGVRTALDFVNRPASWVEANFHVGGLRTWKELQGIVCVEADRGDRRKSICTSRSFADMLEDEDELIQRVSDFAAMCARKLRSEGSVAYEVTTFLFTNRFRDDLEQYCPSATIVLEVPASSTQEIVSAALRAFRTIYRAGYKYKKAGVVVSSILPQESIPGVLFDFDTEARERNDRISRVMDSINIRMGDKSKSVLRLAVQRPGHYADGIRKEHCSPLYTTSLDDIIKVR